MQKKLSEKHGQKFSLFEIKQTLLVLEKDELVRRQLGCFKLSSDARDQMEDLPNRCTKAQWDHIIGLATTGAFPVLHGYNHQPEGSKVRNIQHITSHTKS